MNSSTLSMEFEKERVDTNKYVGKYRVMAERDENGKPCEFTYLKCRKGVKIYRYDDELLMAYIPSSYKGNRIIKEYGNYIEKVTKYDGEMDLYFKEVYLDRLKDIFKIHIKGRDIKPRNKYKSRVKGRDVKDDTM